MQIEVLSKNIKQNFLDVFSNEVANIPVQIKAMLKEKNIRFIILDYVYDLYDEERRQKYKEFYKDEAYKTWKTRGLTSDVDNCIAISCVNTQIEHIPAILYHEIGHFIDAYKNWPNVDELGLTFSSKKVFIDAYTKDFVEHYEQIKNDKNDYLIHFVQKSTPDNINQVGIIETFAELFRWAYNKENSVKTVELYFPTAFIVAKQLVNESFDLGLY